MNPERKLNICCVGAEVSIKASCFEGLGSAQLSFNSKNRIAFEKKRDNPHSDRFIEVGTKALRRETDVWGDAAGTAPAVTSVTSLAFDLFLGTIKSAPISAPSLYQEQTSKDSRPMRRVVLGFSAGCTVRFFARRITCSHVRVPHPAAGRVSFWDRDPSMGGGTY